MCHLTYGWYEFRKAPYFLEVFLVPPRAILMGTNCEMINKWWVIYTYIKSGRSNKWEGNLLEVRGKIREKSHWVHHFTIHFLQRWFLLGSKVLGTNMVPFWIHPIQMSDNSYEHLNRSAIAWAEAEGLSYFIKHVLNILELANNSVLILDENEYFFKSSLTYT